MPIPLAKLAQNRLKEIDTSEYFRPEERRYHGWLAQGNLTQTHVEEILSHLASNTLDGTDEPLRVYLTCYRILGTSGDPRTQDILDTAHRLLQEQAAKISDEEMRRSFLENVVAHREIVREWERMSE